MGICPMRRVSCWFALLLKPRGYSADTRAAIGSIPGRVHVLVQLEHIPRIKERKELEAKGIKLLSYIPNKAWFASIPSDKAGEIAALSNVRAIGEIFSCFTAEHAEAAEKGK